jgi:Flp pilus assembly protein TadG
VGPQSPTLEAFTTLNQNSITVGVTLQPPFVTTSVDLSATVVGVSVQPQGASGVASVDLSAGSNLLTVQAGSPSVNIPPLDLLAGTQSLAVQAQEASLFTTVDVVAGSNTLGIESQSASISASISTPANTIDLFIQVQSAFLDAGGVDTLNAGVITLAVNPQGATLQSLVNLNANVLTVVVGVGVPSVTSFVSIGVGTVIISTVPQQALIYLFDSEPVEVVVREKSSIVLTLTNSQLRILEQSDTLRFKGMKVVTLEDKSPLNLLKEKP